MELCKIPLAGGVYGAGAGVGYGASGTGIIKSQSYSFLFLALCSLLPQTSRARSFSPILTIPG